MHDPISPWTLFCVAYIGPEAFLPFTSALAAIAGALLIFWNRVAGFARRIWQMFTRRPE